MKFFSPKLFSAFKGYSASKLVSDLVAGIIVAIIALPLSIALAIASGVSPQQGLYTAIVAGFVIAFLGGDSLGGEIVYFSGIPEADTDDLGIFGCTEILMHSVILCHIVPGNDCRSFR